MKQETFLEIQERNHQLQASTDALNALGLRHEFISDFLFMQAQINGVYNALMFIAENPLLSQEPKDMDLSSLNRLKREFSNVDNLIQVFKKFNLKNSKRLIDELESLKKADTFLGDKAHQELISSFRLIYQDLEQKSDVINELFLAINLLHKSETHLNQLIADRVWRENAEVQEFVFQCQRDLVRDAIDSAYGITLMNIHYADIFIDLKKRMPERNHAGFPLVLDQMMFSMQWRAIMYSLIYDGILKKASRAFFNKAELQELDLAFHRFSATVFKENLLNEANVFLETEKALRQTKSVVVPTPNYFSQKHAFIVSLIKEEFFSVEDRELLIKKTKQLLTFSFKDFFDVAEKSDITGNFHAEVQYLKESGIFDKLKQHLL